MLKNIKTIVLVSLLLIGAFSIFSSRVNASEQKELLSYSLDIKGIDYPSSVQIGEDIVIEVTVEHCLMRATGLHIFVYENGKWENPFENAHIDRSAMVISSDIKWIRGAPMPLEGVPYHKVSRELSESTFTITYGYPQSASSAVELIIDAYISVPYLIHKELYMPMDSRVISIDVESSNNHGLVVNGGFEYGVNGWSLDNQTGGTTIALGSETVHIYDAQNDMLVPSPIASPKSTNVIPVSQSPCIRIQNHRHVVLSPMRTGIEQKIAETILDKDTQISFKTRITAQRVNVLKTALTQLSIVFEDEYRINYQIVKQEETQSPLLYREKLTNEADIHVTEVSTDWQYISRNINDDFVSSFGSNALRPFNYATVIVETACMGSLIPYVVYFDDIALNEAMTSTTSSSKQTTIQEPTEPVPTSESTEPAPTPESTAPVPTPEQHEEILQTSQTYLPALDWTIISAIAMICAVSIIISVTFLRTKKKRS